MNSPKNNATPNVFTVYKASAGSGKTFTLTAEYLSMLLAREGDGDHRNILAVTFTNKATAEMKERILSELWNIAFDKSAFEGKGMVRAVIGKLAGVERTTDEDYEKKLDSLVEGMMPQEREQMRRSARKAMVGILHDYDHFQVSTIDSFFQQLLSNLAHELGMAAGYKVDLNDKDTIAMAVAQVVANPEQHKGVKEWMVDYIQERIDENERWDITKDVTDIAGELTSGEFMEREDDIKGCIEEERRVNDYVRKLKTMENSAIGRLKKEVENFRKTVTDYSWLSHANYLTAYLDKMQSGNLDEPSSSVAKYIGKEEGDGEDVDCMLKTADKGKDPMMQLARDLRRKLKPLEQTRTEVANTVNSCRLSRCHLRSLRLLGEVNDEVGRILKRSNAFLLAKTPMLFKKLDEKDADFVFEKAGTDLHHIMIDEFQDTSQMQWDNFKRLFSESFSKGYSCMLVGDTKQGIYRFRGGDWKMLSQIVADKGVKEWRAKVEDLKVNYRSCQEVVRFNNEFFQHAAEKMDEEFGDRNGTVKNIYSDVAQKDMGRKGGNVEIRIELKKKTEKKGAKKKGEKSEVVPATEEENVLTSVEEEMVGKVKELRAQGVAYGQMAVLVRQNKDATRLLAQVASIDPSLPIVSDEAFTLGASPAVMTVVNALRFLVDRTDTVALTYVAKNYSLLHSPNGSAEESAGVYSNPMAALPEEFSMHLDELRDMTIYELCEKILEIFDISQMDGAASYICSFMDAVQAYIDDNPPTAVEFLGYWDEVLYKKSIPAGETGGIRILTVHKSKGLAFHTVLMPYCDWTLQKSRQGDLLWCTPNSAPYDEMKLLPIPVFSKKAVEASIYNDDYQKERLQRRVENLNLMYVAFTRAKQNLYVWATAHEETPAEMTMGDVIYDSLKGKLSPSDSGRLTYGLKGEATLTSASGKGKKGEGAKPAADFKLVNPFTIEAGKKEAIFETMPMKTVFLQSNGAADFISSISSDSDGEPSAEGKQREYIERGKLLHNVFSTIKKAEDVETVMESLQRQGIIADKKTADELRRFIEKRINQDGVADWFGGDWKVVNERSIVFFDGEGRMVTRRPDRVMVGEGRTVVVDFKFGRHREEYEQQVKEYCQLLSGMGYEGVEGYLWYVYSGEVKRVDINY